MWSISSLLEIKKREKQKANKTQNSYKQESGGKVEKMPQKGGDGTAVAICIFTSTTLFMIIKLILRENIYRCEQVMKRKELKDDSCYSKHAITSPKTRYSVTQNTIGSVPLSQERYSKHDRDKTEGAQGENREDANTIIRVARYSKHDSSANSDVQDENAGQSTKESEKARYSKHDSKQNKRGASYFAKSITHFRAGRVIQITLGSKVKLAGEILDKGLWYIDREKRPNLLDMRYLAECLYVAQQTKDAEVSLLPSELTRSRSSREYTRLHESMCVWHDEGVIHYTPQPRRKHIIVVQFDQNFYDRNYARYSFAFYLFVYTKLKPLAARLFEVLYTKFGERKGWEIYPDKLASKVGLSVARPSQALYKIKCAVEEINDFCSVRLRTEAGKTRRMNKLVFESDTLSSLFGAPESGGTLSESPGPEYVNEQQVESAGGADLFVGEPEPVVASHHNSSPLKTTAKPNSDHEFETSSSVNERPANPPGAFFSSGTDATPEEIENPALYLERRKREAAAIAKDRAERLQQIDADTDEETRALQQARAEEAHQEYLRRKQRDEERREKHRETQTRVKKPEPQMTYEEAMQDPRVREAWERQTGVPVTPEKGVFQVYLTTKEEIFDRLPDDLSECKPQIVSFINNHEEGFSRVLAALRYTMRQSNNAKMKGVAYDIRRRFVNHLNYGDGMDELKFDREQHERNQKRVREVQEKIAVAQAERRAKEEARRVAEEQTQRFLGMIAKIKPDKIGDLWLSAYSDAMDMVNPPRQYHVRLNFAELILKASNEKNGGKWERALLSNKDLLAKLDMPEIMKNNCQKEE